MKYFKVKAVRTAQRYEISARSFSSATQNKLPFEQKGNNGVVRQYGICPSCLNPVQLIGLYKRTKTKPYGRHTGKNIDGLPKWNFNQYQYCPFAKSNVKKEISADERGIVTEQTVELYDLLRAQFDRVVYVIRKSIGIVGSINFWTEALIQFRSNEGYCYPWLTESNLPYIFAFFGLQQQNLYRQQIYTDSKLYAALCKCPTVNFDSTANPKCVQVINKGNHFISLYLRFTNHEQRAVEGDELKESVTFCVDDRITNEAVFETRLKFDETRFMNLVSKNGNGEKRDNRLLDLAAENLPPIKPTE